MNEVINERDYVKTDELLEENEKLKAELAKYKKWYEEIKVLFEEEQTKLEVYKDLYCDLIERVLERVNDD